MSRPELVSVLVVVRCECGEMNDFDEVQDGAEYTQDCGECGRAISVQVDEPLVQYRTVTTKHSPTCAYLVKHTEPCDCPLGAKT